MSPATFRRHLCPGYERMCQLAREAGAETYMHSDGHILELFDDLMAAGFSVINPQVGCIGIDRLANLYKGRVCLDADIDRQQILPHGSPEQVRKHVEEIVRKLGSKDGGLMMIAGVYADVPLQNIEALAQAMEEYQYHYS
jgi:uroporphyrinogen decarboxylase